MESFQFNKAQSDSSENHLSNVSNVTYRIVSVPEKGQCMVALRDIKKGELILKEQPVLRFRSPINMDSFQQAYDLQFKKLSITNQQSIMELFDANQSFVRVLVDSKGIEDEYFIKWFSIICTNSFKWDDKLALFLNASRVNHSCIPNADYNFSYPFLRIYSVRDINKGEELCIAYEMAISFDRPPTIDAIKKELMINYCFSCNCKLCSMEDEKKRKEIEDHRIRYWEMDNKLYDVPTKIGPKERLRYFAELFREIEKGCLLNPRYIAVHGKEAFNLAMICKEYSQADHYIKEVYEASLIMEGVESPVTKHYLSLMKNPLYRQKHWDKGSFR